MTVAERGVDHRGVRHAGHQFIDADARQQRRARGQPVVGDAVEFEQGTQVLIVVGDGHEHTVAVGKRLRRDEPVRVESPNEGERRMPHHDA